jgi:3-phenylpropionate/trans-cinnamate dioxygenase ferredoxin reductase component
MTDRTYLIVGGGLAAAEAAKTLRDEGYNGPLTVVTDEPHLPYERPPLTKAYLRGEAEATVLLPKPATWYEEAGIDLRLGTRVESLDLAFRRARLAGGGEIAWERLLLATGSRAVRPAMDGVDRPWVHLLRTAEDADRLRDAARASSSAVVAGGGWIAAEAAASLAQMGLQVTLAVPGDEVLERHLGPVVGARFSALHDRHGVRLVRGARVEAVIDRGVRLSDDVLKADLVVLGFGARPATELARTAGLSVGTGILADEQLETAAQGVFVAGDVAEAWNPRYGTRMRSEHWDNARRQARTAARNLLGRAESYDRVPFFFSDQYELGMELVGRPDPDAEVVIRETEKGYVALWLREGRAVAGMHTDTWNAKKPLDALVTAGTAVDPRAFEDPSVPLDAVQAEAAGAAVGRSRSHALLTG